MCQISLILIKKRFCIKSIQSWISCWSKSVFCVDWKWREKRVCSVGWREGGSWTDGGQNNFSTQSPTWGRGGTLNQGLEGFCKIFGYNTSSEKVFRRRKTFQKKDYHIETIKLFSNLMLICLFLQSGLSWTMSDNWMGGEYGNWPTADLRTHHWLPGVPQVASTDIFYMLFGFYS